MRVAAFHMIRELRALKHGSHLEEGGVGQQKIY